MIEEKRIKSIIRLSKKLGNDSDKIIEMMQHHTAEIKELYSKKNRHFAVETGDLVILAVQLLMMEGYSAKKIMESCYGRFDKKLDGLIKAKNKKNVHKR